MTDAEKIAEIQRLLMEAYDHYFSYESHCKSYEGTIAIYYPNVFEQRDGKTAPTYEISSYVFADGRMEEFKTLDDALETVRQWHADEMAFVPGEDHDRW